MSDLLDLYFIYINNYQLTKHKKQTIFIKYILYSVQFIDVLVSLWNNKSLRIKFF